MQEAEDRVVRAEDGVLVEEVVEVVVEAVEAGISRLAPTI
jgi:hypothetical protein